MTIRHIELLSVRADDGLASAAELAELEAAGLDPFAWHPTRALLVEVLTPPHPAPRQLVGDTLRALELADAAGLDDIDPLLTEVLCPPRIPSLVPEVFSALALDTADDDQLHTALHAVLVAESDGAPDLVGDVLAHLDLAMGDDLDAAVRDALAAGAEIELVDAVFAQLALAEADSLESADIRGALLGDTPALAEDVLERLGLQAATALSAQVADALRPDTAPALAGDVLASLGLDAAMDTDGLVREALRSTAVPELWDGVAAEIGADAGVGALLREAVAAQAGTVDLVDAVMAEIGAVAAETETGAVVVPLRPVAERGLWTAAFGGLLAAAAAVMLFLLPSWMGIDSGMGVPSEVGAFVVAEVDNTADIESLEAGPDALVQFFQGEEGAPTIIFINEMDEPEATSGQDDGVPL